MSWSLYPAMLHLPIKAEQSLEHHWKRRLSQSQLPTMHITASHKTVIPQHNGQLFNTSTSTGWKAEKWTIVSLYSNELLIQKCEFGGRVVGSNVRLASRSPKGSYHHGEVSMSNTLAKNCHCEFCCGMHRTWQKHTKKLTRRMNTIIINYIYIYICI